MSTPAAPPRHADHPIDPLFIDRWSPRAFTPDTLPTETLMSLFEAARWSPSGSNSQPWRFAYGLRGTPAFEAVLGSLVAFNQDWARHAAALVVVASTHQTLAPGGTEPKKLASHAFDTGAAWMQLALQAHLSGWVAHAMGGFDAAKARAAVAAPEHLALHAVVAIGRQGEASRLPEGLREREQPNGRKPVSALAFEGRFPESV